MKKSFLILAVTAALIPLSFHFKTDKASAEANAKQYVITACGETSVNADSATITVGVDTFSLTLADGESANTAAAEKVKQAFAPYGTVKESYLSAYPAYDKNGYNVNRTLQCFTEQVGSVGEILKVLTQSGISKICGITYDTKNIKTAEQTALKNAEANAVEKAAALAPNLKLAQLKEFSCFSCYSETCDGKITVQAYVEAIFIQE